jgi:formylglycine-generating enzyme required for sulfatase activity
LIEFPVITVDDKGNKVKEETGKAGVFKENLGSNALLEMVGIPNGTFTMGSPADEAEREANEGPQQEVNVNAFLMGRYPITQTQWQAVAKLPKVKDDLPPAPAPSYFKGANYPVERVTWHQAVEFCARLSKHSGREYRLPSEAEWEYACRAKTTTPFHFGPTLTTDLANYNGNYTYGSGPKGVYREKTSAVGSFPPNAFGLCDMHGNVWEWCLDHWYDNYQGAPTDGTAWVTGGDADLRLLRGGSWYVYPRLCRSAGRLRLAPGVRSIVIGFRVVCGSAWTL